MWKLNDKATLTLDDGVATLTIDSPPVNALSAEVRAGLKTGVEIAVADANIRVLIIACAGKTFIAGADIAEFDRPPSEPLLPDVLALIENANKPVIAAVNGAALGGGCEVALAAHYRFAGPRAKFGLPELRLGVIPGAGGTQRLPRLTGVEKALDMILSAAPIVAEEALRAGLADALAGDGDFIAATRAFASELLARGAGPRRTCDRPLAAQPKAIEKARAAWAKKYRGQQAWEKALAAIEAAGRLPFAAGLAAERALFFDLRSSDQARALRYAFFAERQVDKVPGLDPSDPARDVASVGVIGAGTMGGGIAMNFLNAGWPVVIVETGAEALERGLANIHRTYESSVTKSKLTRDEAEARLARLTGALDLAALAGTDLIIEAVFEDMDVKRDLFRRLDRLAKPGAILATNTSYLDVDAIAAETSRPQDVIGLHFFSPAHIMRLLEIVRAEKTAKDVLAAALKIAKRIGKIGVVVGVCHGFVGNRMLSARQREAARLLAEGALPWDVDRALTNFGFPMGPFAMSDLAGVDIGWLAATTSSSTIKEILCERGRKGQKTRAGYYDYDEARKASPSPVVEQIIVEFSAARGISRRAISEQEILERCLYPMINEGAKILGEGIARRASDVDVVWLNGYGWPAWRGGPLFYADAVGLPVIFERLAFFSRTISPDFAPAPLLKKLAEDGGRLVHWSRDGAPDA